MDYDYNKPCTSRQSAYYGRRRRSRSRTRSRSRSRSRSRARAKSPTPKDAENYVDKKKLLDIAKTNLSALVQLQLQASEKKQSKTGRPSETKSVQDFVEYCKKIAEDKSPPQPQSTSSNLSRSLDETSSKDDYSDKYGYLNVSNKV